MADNPPLPTDVEVRLNELGQVSASVGHGVINAFCTIVSNAELLRMLAERGGGRQSVELSQIIVKTAIDASNVARKLIDHSRLATTTNRASVSLHQFADQEVEARRKHGARGVSWETDLTDVPPIAGDADQLRRMLDYLIGNALEALPEEGGQITLATGTDDRGWTWLEVRDTGAGMRPEVQERAVEPFFTTKPGRTGLGLTIANGIWRRHGGMLSIRCPGNDEQTCPGVTIRLLIEPQPVSSAAETA